LVTKTTKNQHEEQGKRGRGKSKKEKERNEMVSKSAQPGTPFNIPWGTWTGQTILLFIITLAAITALVFAVYVYIDKKDIVGNAAFSGATSYTIGGGIFDIAVDNGNVLVPLLSLGGTASKRSLVTEATNQGVEAPPILDVLNGDLAIQFRPFTMYRVSLQGTFGGQVPGNTVKFVLMEKYTNEDGVLMMRKFTNTSSFRLNTDSVEATGFMDVMFNQSVLLYPGFTSFHKLKSEVPITFTVESLGETTTLDVALL
jgi:hypothetical protein